MLGSQNAKSVRDDRRREKKDGGEGSANCLPFDLGRIACGADSPVEHVRVCLSPFIHHTHTHTLL